jgi:hypothetical protein
MGIPIDFSPIFSSDCFPDLSPLWSTTSSRVPAEKEHPYMVIIRQALLEYRQQSSAHWAVNVNVEQAQVSAEDHMSFLAFSGLEVIFRNFEGSMHTTCRPEMRKHPRRNFRIPTNKIEVLEGGYKVNLEGFLDANYPHSELVVSVSNLRDWWTGNGKSFNWIGLPTELKERVVQFCLHQRDDAQFRQQAIRHFSRFGARGKVGGDRCEFGIYEIVDQLGDWAALISVSHQVRAIAVRLCLQGNSDMLYGNGFCLCAGSYKKFGNAIRRLGRYYQMVEPNGLPIDPNSRALAHCYKQHPHLYPQLTQYATFRHGLRKVCLVMNFISSMHFFRVSHGGFERFWYPKHEHMTYEVFDLLPNLKEIEIRLPIQPHAGWKDNVCQRGPRLFHHRQPCPRTLHRLIYTRIAEVLAPYNTVHVINFGDEQESKLFKQQRKEAQAKLTLTKKDYEELYVECGGGVELDEMVEPGSWLRNTFSEEVDEKAEIEHEIGGFFPPRCRCVNSCHRVYLEKEQRTTRR